MTVNADPSKPPVSHAKHLHSLQEQIFYHAWISQTLTSTSTFLFDCFFLLQTEPVIHHFLKNFSTTKLCGKLFLWVFMSELLNVFSGSLSYIEKSKIIPVLIWAWHEDMAELQLYAYLTLAVNGDGWLASYPGCFHHSGKNAQYPLDGRLGGPQSHSRCYEGERNLTLLGIKPTFLIHPAIV
jgi:hypothetical protein